LRALLINPKGYETIWETFIAYTDCMKEVFSWSKYLISTMLQIKKKKTNRKVWAFKIIKNVAGLLGALYLKSEGIDFLALREDS
tara:strand:- start:65 stop:316 length:252 start_codon:yes stop_codon:yes gene_type:complete